MFGTLDGGGLVHDELLLAEELEPLLEEPELEDEAGVGVGVEVGKSPTL